MNAGKNKLCLKRYFLANIVPVSPKKSS